MYTVTWHGMDGSFHEDEKDTLKEAQEWATYVEDHGAWSVKIENEDGDEIE